MYPLLLLKPAVFLALSFLILASKQTLRYENQALVKAYPQPGSGKDNPTAVLQEVDLELEKSVDNTAPHMGDNITFTVVLANQGPGEATGITVTDQLPSGYNYVSNTASPGSYDNVTGDWDVGTLAAGQSATLTITARVNASGDCMNRAEVTAQNEPDADSTPNNGVDTDGDGVEVDDPGDEDDGDAQEVCPMCADLELDIAVSNSTPQLGDVVTFTIAVSNQGPDNATGVAIEDSFGYGYSGITNISAGGIQSGFTITWSDLYIPVGGTILLTFDAVVGGLSFEYFNIAQVTASHQCDPDSTPNNDDGDQSEDDEDIVGTVTSVDIFSNAAALCPTANDPLSGTPPPLCETVCANTIVTYYISGYRSKAGQVRRSIVRSSMIDRPRQPIDYQNCPTLDW